GGDPSPPFPARAPHHADNLPSPLLAARGQARGGSSMKTRRGFPREIVEAIRKGQVLGIRAGTQPHRVIAIWAVVVEGRVFVRSWSLKPRSWWRTSLEDPRGII